jgi:ABC-type uncharacterized transport system ATPase subunit
VTSGGSRTAAAPVGAAAVGTVVRMEGITKRFGDVVANDAIDLDVRSGEVLGLLGENGAGKTTLMRILFGLTAADRGAIEIGGRVQHIAAPSDAIAAGVGMVTQHFSLVGPMTVAENVVLGATPRFRLDLRSAAERVRAVAEHVGIAVDPLATVADLSVGERQRVEIVKALYRDCRVLLLDEPTAVLVPQEVDALFAAIDRLTDGGLAVVFISHKLNEVRRICDRVTVLRQGQLVDTVRTGEVDDRELARLMVGRPTIGVQPRDPGVPGKVQLRLDGVTIIGTNGLPAVREVDLTVRAGEVVGVAGVSGNGQRELAEALAGIRPPVSGTVEVGGREVAAASPDEMMRAGIGRIPEDRHAAVVDELSVAYNLVIEHLPEYRRRGQLDERRIRAKAEELIDRFRIKARPSDRIATLSGGNMQKVILARVLDRGPEVLVVSQPTRGLDIGATEYVREQLLDQRERGCAVLLFSEDLDELLTLADRIVVMYEGRLVADLPADQADRQQVGLLMAGKEPA